VCEFCNRPETDDNPIGYVPEPGSSDGRLARCEECSFGVTRRTARPMPESARKAWRDGIAPQLSTNALQALRRGLLRDDSRLTQGSTTTPPPMQCVLEWPCEGGCLIAYAGWQGDGLATVGEVEEFFARVCMKSDFQLGEPAASRYLLNWFDDADRDDMRRELIAEINATLADRQERASLAALVAESAPQSSEPDPFDNRLHEARRDHFNAVRAEQNGDAA
jgi:hypothetical protein